MATSIQEAVLNMLPAKARAASSGWRSFNAVCCQHNGETMDTRNRGGVATNPDGGIAYHCFNCGFKTSYQPGRPLSFKFKKWLGWLGASESQVHLLVVEALRIKDFISITMPATETAAEPVQFAVREMPKDSKSFADIAESYELTGQPVPKEFADAVDYIIQRKIDMQRYEFFWTPETEYKLNCRVIIPFTWQKNIIGYSARAVVGALRPKYYSNHASDFVFNMDMQLPDNKFVIVCEGLFDAMSVDGVALCGNECSEQQAEIIDSLGKEVIVVPDFDCHENKWAGAKLIDHAIEYGWSVSFPVWAKTCKDVNEATVKYGKLFVLKSILDSRESSKLKIELHKRKIING